jgi:hypothetical protein
LGRRNYFIVLAALVVKIYRVGLGVGIVARPHHARLVVELARSQPVLECAHEITVQVRMLHKLDTLAVPASHDPRPDLAVFPEIDGIKVLPHLFIALFFSTYTFAMQDYA